MSSYSSSEGADSISEPETTHPSANMCIIYDSDDEHVSNTDHPVQMFGRMTDTHHEPSAESAEVDTVVSSQSLETTPDNSLTADAIPTGMTANATTTTSTATCTLICTECENELTTDHPTYVNLTFIRSITRRWCEQCGEATLHGLTRDENPIEIPVPPSHAPTCTYQNRKLTNADVNQSLHIFQRLLKYCSRADAVRSLTSGDVQSRYLHDILEEAIQMSHGAWDDLRRCIEAPDGSPSNSVGNSVEVDWPRTIATRTVHTRPIQAQNAHARQVHAQSAQSRNHETEQDPMLVDDLTFLSHITGGAPFQEQPEALKTAILTTILAGSENHAERSVHNRSSGSSDKHGKIEILASISHDIHTGKTEVHPAWLRDFRDILFPTEQETVDHDLRDVTNAVPARNPSLDHDEQ